MTAELLYTSAPAGLKRGSRGFCTVLATEGMPANVATRLEMLSAYRHVYSPQDAHAAENPVAWSHVRLGIAGSPVSVLSRVSAYGTDYSGRTNKLAHHVVVPTEDQVDVGPAWLLINGSIMRRSWDGNCVSPAAGPTIPQAERRPQVCRVWESVAGDAGWGGAIPQAITAGNKPLWIVYRVDQRERMLELIDESLALLPAAQRWQATFSTYYTGLPPEFGCRICCVLAGTPEAKSAATRGSVLDLTQPLGAPPAGAWTAAARGGSAATAAPVTLPSPPLEAASPLQPLPSSDENLTNPWEEEELRLGPPVPRTAAGRGLPMTPPKRASRSGPPAPPTRRPPPAPAKRSKLPVFLALNTVSLITLAVLLAVGTAAIIAAAQYAKTIQQLASPDATTRRSSEPAHSSTAGSSYVPELSGPSEAGPPEAGPPEAGPPKAGPPKAGPPEAGPPEAGPPEAGPPEAVPPEAGPPEAGPPEAGPPEAGPPDAGPTEAGPPQRKAILVRLPIDWIAGPESKRAPFTYELETTFSRYVITDEGEGPAQDAGRAISFNELSRSRGGEADLRFTITNSVIDGRVRINSISYLDTEFRDAAEALRSEYEAYAGLVNKFNAFLRKNRSQFDATKGRAAINKLDFKTFVLHDEGLNDAIQHSKSVNGIVVKLRQEIDGVLMQISGRDTPRINNRRAELERLSSDEIPKAHEVPEGKVRGARAALSGGKVVATVDFGTLHLTRSPGIGETAAEISVPLRFDFVFDIED